jgi:nucleoside-diphosphate-sugar epimerase
VTATFDPAVFRGVRVVVLGGTGFIGGHVVDRLLAYGATPILLCRKKPRLPAKWAGRVAVYDEPISSLKAVAEALATCFAFNEAALAINLAAVGVLPGRRDPQAMASANGLLAETVAKSVGELAADLPTKWPGVSLLHVGSALEYGTHAQSLDEAAPCRPDEPYGKSKLRGTEAVRRAREELGLAALVARAFTVFGPGEPEGRLTTSLVARCGDDLPIDLTAGTQTRDLAYVEDVAEGLLRLAASPRQAVLKKEGPYDAGIINLATGVSTPIKDFATAAAREFLIDEARLRFGALPSREDDTDHPAAPIERLKAATGGFALSSDHAAGLRRMHRRVLASLYEPKPAAEEREGEPEKRKPEGRPEGKPEGRRDGRPEGRPEGRPDGRPRQQQPQREPRQRQEPRKPRTPDSA